MPGPLGSLSGSKLLSRWKKLWNLSEWPHAGSVVNITLTSLQDTYESTVSGLPLTHTELGKETLGHPEWEPSSLSSDLKVVLNWTQLSFFPYSPQSELPLAGSVFPALFGLNYFFELWSHYFWTVIWSGRYSFHSSFCSPFFSFFSLGCAF